MRTLEIPPVDGHGARGANHWQGRAPLAIARQARQWKHHTRLAARSSIAAQGQLDGRPPYVLRASIPLVNWQTADGHNYSSYEVKWIVDGLIDAGLIPGDTSAELTLHDPAFRKKQRPTDPVVVVVSWYEACPECGRPVDTGTETQPAPWCSEDHAPADLFADGDFEYDCRAEQALLRELGT